MRTQLSLTRNPVDCSPPGSSVHELIQARILEWVAISSSRGSSRPRDQAHVSYVFCVGRQVLHHLGSPMLSFCYTAKCLSYTCIYMYPLF